MQTHFSSTKFSGNSRSLPTSLAEINVTPLVDVMLVLLIVFMISAPLMQQGLQVDLPKANAEAIHETQEQLVLVIDKNRRIFIADIAIEHGTLAKKIDAIVRAKPSTEIVIQADQAIPYGFVAQVMSTVKQAGIHRVGLAMNPGDPKGLL